MNTNGNVPPAVQVPGVPQIAPENDIDITLTMKLSMVNTIIASLDELPHKFSRAVIDTIHQQATAQIGKVQESQGLGGELANKVQ